MSYIKIINYNQYNINNNENQNYMRKEANDKYFLPDNYFDNQFLII